MRVEEAIDTHFKHKLRRDHAMELQQQKPRSRRSLVAAKGRWMRSPHKLQGKINVLMGSSHVSAGPSIAQGVRLSTHEGRSVSKAGAH